jgi:hypothetical protein
MGLILILNMKLKLKLINETIIPPSVFDNSVKQNSNSDGDVNGDSDSDNNSDIDSDASGLQHLIIEDTTTQPWQNLIHYQ